MSYLTPEYVERLFTHHPPKDQAMIEAHEKVRAEGKVLALRWLTDLPDSAEKTLAIRSLHEAVKHANTAIALGL